MTTGWQYRIFKHADKYGIHPVFVDENGDVVHIDDIPSIYADDLTGLLKQENLRKEAWDYPVLNFETGENL